MIRIDLYLILFGVGILFVVLALFHVDLGDYIGIETLTLACCFMSFGACGYITRSWILAAIFSILFTIAIHFLVVVKLRKMQNSNGASEASLVGMLAVVTVPISETGVGEIYFPRGISVSNQPARSFDKVAIPSGKKVHVIDVKEGICLVSKIMDLDEEESFHV